MKDSISFVRNILDLTKTGKLKWEQTGEEKSITFFAAVQGDTKFTFLRAIDKHEYTKAVSYRLGSSTGKKITIYKNEDAYIDPEESEAFDLLDELARLIDPGGNIPVIRINPVDYVVGGITYHLGKLNEKD